MGDVPNVLLLLVQRRIVPVLLCHPPLLLSLLQDARQVVSRLDALQGLRVLLVFPRDEPIKVKAGTYQMWFSMVSTLRFEKDLLCFIREPTVAIFIIKLSQAAARH